MATDQKISGMTAATTPLTGTESVELVQGGVNKQATVQDIADLANPPTTPDLATVLTNGNDASGISLIGLPSPTVGSEATNKNYVDSAVGSVGTPPLGSVVVQGNDTSGVIITGLPTPTANTDAANKQYVDGVASGSSHLADYTTINDAAPLAANCNSLKEPKFYTEIANNRTIDFTNVRAVNNANQYCTVFWIFKKTVAGDIVITLDADSSQFTNKDLASDTAVTSYTLTGVSNSYFKLTAVFHGESSGSIVWWNLVTTSGGGGGGTWGSITGTLSSQTDLQAALDAKLALTGGTMSGAIAMDSQKITGLGAATTNGDAVRFQQLPVNADASTAGLVKLYTSTGSSTDGTMDRNSITNAIAAVGGNDLADFTTLTDAAPVVFDLTGIKEPKGYLETGTSRTLDLQNLRSDNQAGKYTAITMIIKKTTGSDIVLTLDTGWTNKDLVTDGTITTITLTGALNSYHKIVALARGETLGANIWWNYVVAAAGSLSSTLTTGSIYVGVSNVGTAKALGSEFDYSGSSVILTALGITGSKIAASTVTLGKLLGTTGAGERILVYDNSGAVTGPYSTDTGTVTNSTVITALTTETSWTNDTKTVSNLLEGQFYHGTGSTGIKYLYYGKADGTAVRTAAAEGIDITSIQLPPCTEVTGTSQSMSVNNAYVANNASLVTLTLPSTATVGDIVEVAGKGAGGWRIAQNSGQTIHGATNSTTGTSGHIDSGAQYNCVKLKCITANTDWVIHSSVGTISIT